MPAEAVQLDPVGPSPSATPGIVWWPVAVIAAIILILAGTDAYLFASRPAARASAAGRDRLLSQAKAQVAAVSSYDYRNLPKSEQAAEAGLIEPFKSAYVKSFTSIVMPAAPQIKAIASCQIQNAALTSLSGNGKQAVVLIFAQLAVQNTTTTTSTPRLDVATVTATMDKVKGNWFISNLASS